MTSIQKPPVRHPSLQQNALGLTKRDYLHMEQSEQVLAWQRKWKSLWDPTGLLNPGKVIPGRKTACTE